jgi:glycosyltransferase involved in cell wall biosynthesis
VRILLVSHEASRTGAPKIACEVARSLRERGHRVSTVLRWRGPLAAELAEASSSFRLEPLRRTRALVRRLWPRARLSSRFEELVAFGVIAAQRPDVVYANTVKSACYVRPALWCKVPVVLHVHELEPLASDTLARYSLSKHWQRIRLVACSDAVRDNLVEITKGAGKVVTVPSLVDADEVRQRAARPVSKPLGRIVVGGCGRADARKGFDLWLSVVRTLLETRPDLPLDFVWIGRVDDDASRAVRARGLEDRIRLPGEVAEPAAYLAAIDLFTLPSRVDPFPLVVLEAMALARPVVAFAVGGVPDQVGQAGVLIDPEDVGAFAAAVARLAEDAPLRTRLGVLAGERASGPLDIQVFRDGVVCVVEALRETPRHSVIFRAIGTRAPLRMFLLKSYDAREAIEHAAPGPWRLPYSVDAVTEFGVELHLTDAHLRAPWTQPPLRRVVRRLERMSTPFMQTLVARSAISRSDVVLAMFESQGNALALARAMRLRFARRPSFAIVACWLVRDLEHFDLVRRSIYRLAYRGVDRLFVFSQNQVAILEQELGVTRDRLVPIAFGVDHHYFEPSGAAEHGYVLAVGRDEGRDWHTLVEAARGEPWTLLVACRPGALAGLSLPPNVQELGFVSRERYRELLQHASVVAVITTPRPYPTGQSVALEAMAMERCCIVTETEPMKEYVNDDENALLVAPGDVLGVKSAVSRALSDENLRRRIGRAARARVETEFNAERMWSRIAAELECLRLPPST